MPNISFTEFILEVTLLPADDRVTGPAREPASTSGGINEEEEKDKVAVNYADLQFMLSAEDSIWIIACYDLEVLIPYELERLYHPLDSYVTLSETYLKFRVSFAYTFFFVEVLKYFGLIVF